MAVLICCELFLGCLFVAEWAIGSPSFRLNVWLDFEHEDALATWFSSVQLFSVGLVLALFSVGLHLKGERDFALLMLPPMLFMFLSADEVMQVHEWIGYKLFPQERRRTSVFGYVGIWGFVLGPLLLGFAAWLGCRAAKYLRGERTICRRYALGMLIFVGAGAFVETAANFVERESAAHMLQVLVEEVGEMIGVTIILWATWDLLRRHALSPLLVLAARHSDRRAGAAR